MSSPFASVLASLTRQRGVRASLVVDESDGIVSLPFFGESCPVLAEAVKVPWCCESDGFPPPLMQTTVAE